MLLIQVEPRDGWTVGFFLLAIGYLCGNHMCANVLKSLDIRANMFMYSLLTITRYSFILSV